ncbi:metal-sensitive transcriptional regulator [Polycyclovorans algicola]|uniref:metal-sensitive transcriptional regulator n=1 Tax=Polycyclovorans algicola TaxID=616992 RepID=UPI000A05D3B3|nr:metal-sensing transcriptional repressor [Polycyclovorans algicola]
MGKAANQSVAIPVAAKPKAARARASKAPAAATHKRPHEQEVMNRLRRVEGQIRGVLAMMEDEQPCEAIAQQLAAARKALDRAFYEMMACSLEMDVNDAPNNSVLCQRIAEKTRLLAKYA